MTSSNNTKIRVKKVHVTLCRTPDPHRSPQSVVYYLKAPKDNKVNPLFKREGDSFGETNLSKKEGPTLEGDQKHRGQSY